MAKHARYSPSKLADTEACPCHTSAPQIEGEVNEAADEGTLIHEACEHRNPELLENEEQLSAYENAINYVDRLVGSIAGTPEVRCEVKLTLKDVTFGTADVLIIDRINKILHVCDYKFVRTSVAHAEHNLQLQAYGAAALERFPSFQHVVTHIIAPRINDYTSAQFDRSLLASVRDRIMDIIESAADPFKVPVAGDQCRFCGVKHRCPALAESAEATVRSVGLLPLPERFISDTNGVLSPEDKSKLLLLAKVLPDWAGEIKKAATRDVLEYGDDIPGFSLRRRAGSLSVRDHAEVIRMVTGNMGISPMQLLESGVASLSLSKLAGYVMETNPVEEFSTKRDYVDALETAFGDCVSRSSEVIYMQKDRKPTDAELVEQLTFNNA